jgi:NAD(P)-dependent dehydrogenase (short-subunit alcohol dehydrogenase family)
VAIATGGSRRIGRSAAERLAADGYPVVVGYASNIAGARSTWPRRRPQGKAVGDDDVCSSVPLELDGHHARYDVTGMPAVTRLLRSWL